MKQTLLIITALMLVVGFSNAQTHKGMEFYENGEPKSIKTYKVSKDKIELVKKVSWYSSGQKYKEGTFKDGKEDGKWTSWHNNGQKYIEETYKDGVLDGLWKFWYENGKSGEATFKDGEFITAECWDEDGNEEDCPSWIYEE